MALSWLEWSAIVILLALPLIWNLSHAFRYYVKIISYNGWLILSTALVIPFGIFRPRNVDNFRCIQKLLQKTLPVFGISLEVRHAENLNYDKPCVIVCNHQSSIDVISMMKVLPPKTTALAKKELMYAGPFGLGMWLCGMVFVDRKNHEKAHGTMDNTAKIMHERQLKIWIFPEGTRNFDGHLLPFKKGAFRLAIEAKVPVVPVVFSSYQDFLCKKRKIFNRGKVIISCLPMISTEGLTLDDVGDLMEKTHKAMSDVYESTSNEVHEEAVNNGQSIVQQTH